MVNNKLNIHLNLLTKKANKNTLIITLIEPPKTVLCLSPFPLKCSPTGNPNIRVRPTRAGPSRGAREPRRGDSLGAERVGAVLIDPRELPAYFANTEDARTIGSARPRTQAAAAAEPPPTRGTGRSS